MKFLVTGTTQLTVYKEVTLTCEEVEGLDTTEIEELAIDKAHSTFEGIEAFTGNGGYDKLVGVYNQDESISADDEVEFKYVGKVDDKGVKEL